MFVPRDQVIKVAIVSEIAQMESESGVYIVKMFFDDVPEVFHVELNGPKVSFRVRERIFDSYKHRCPTLKGLYALMRQWHRGERRELPVNLADVDFG